MIRQFVLLAIRSSVAYRLSLSTSSPEHPPEHPAAHQPLARSTIASLAA